jgi:hypothetical protein
VDKVREYAIAGTREYYILHWDKKKCFFYRLEQGKYVRVEPEDGIFRSSVLPGFQFRLADLYTQPEPEEMSRDEVYKAFVGLALQKERQEKEKERQEKEKEKARAEAAERGKEKETARAEAAERGKEEEKGRAEISEQQFLEERREKENLLQSLNKQQIIQQIQSQSFLKKILTFLKRKLS